MKWGVWVAVLALSGCASVKDIQQTPPTLNVISGKKPNEYAQCVDTILIKSRGPSLLTPHKNGIKMVVRDRLSTSPAALLDIEERSNGSSIKLYESMSNNPLRSSAVLDAATRCISGQP
ncbi:hypothetical protein CCU68_27435 [Pseudomonas gingeri NCPPB 3146 = LMG 5327]|uniref:Lipoprotein n=2 Tax=Pseudomonas gingeri TaxID=117681 RepID=A0A7Y7XVG3_9PSED|nr:MULTISPECIES: hypothetical protein [Pseudomonas]NVZ66691.1 hypothetical protein [Pseudomonas gingeri]NVZ74780.1 hypothetical protein [Pseudomonas gingeri]NWC12829.1 hypothetical protein [Pseudomonas gingeri]NWE72205.1 hypothetical protein [Pseudomonas gingeri]PNQ89318.1 hypothetical protein CCU68_27435 [Pseudomonas gingeri NCPPB 3146 = LMG 5327]